MIGSENSELISVTRSDNIIHVSFRPGCTVGADLLMEALQRDLALDDGEGNNDFWDFRGSNIDEKLTYQIVAQMVSQVGVSRKGRWNRKTAMLVDQDLQYGMARMYESLTDDMPFEVGVFRDEQEAMAWLKED